MSSWSKLCWDAMWTVEEANFRQFFAGLPYFIPVNVGNLKVGDRVVCVAKERSPVCGMSELSASQAWDIPVVKITTKKVYVEWVSGIKPVLWFNGLVFEAPYVVSVGKYGRNLSNGRRRRTQDFFNTGSHFKCRCRFDDFLPNPPIRMLVYNQIMDNDNSTWKDVVKSPLIVEESDIYFEILQHHCHQKELQTLLQRIITAHRPYSLLGQMLKEGCFYRIRFVLKNFCVDNKLLNSIRIGSNCYHPTEILVQNCHLLVLGYLLRRRNLQLFGKIMSFDRKRRRHFSAVLSAVEIGNSSIIVWLAKFVPKSSFEQMLSFPDELGRTPLSVAVVKDRPNLVRALLHVKAPVNQCGWGGDTALAIGMQIGISDAVLAMLLDVDASVDIRDSTGVAPKTREIFGRLCKPSGL